VLLSASRHEGAPTVVREARALGTPVVACAAGSLAALAESDDGIWIVPDTVRC
jgi:glycosyltransferase involved in cell wall biosynthesis